MTPKQIKELRLSLGLFQREFARKLRVTKRTIYNLETGRNSPDPMTMARLKEFAKVNKKTPRLRKMSAAQVRRLRKNMGLSQPAFARRVGLQASSVRNLEHGQTEPSLPTLKKLNALADKYL